MAPHYIPQVRILMSCVDHSVKIQLGSLQELELSNRPTTIETGSIAYNYNVLEKYKSLCWSIY